MLLKESFENVHEYRAQRLPHKDTTERRERMVTQTPPL